jgi:hypothetical protein
MVHTALAQKASCAAALAYPSGPRPMSAWALSDWRVTWYSGPVYARYKARVVLMAATHGVAGAKMSQGRAVAVCAEAAPAGAITMMKRITAGDSTVLNDGNWSRICVGEHLSNLSLRTNRNFRMKQFSRE